METALAYEKGVLFNCWISCKKQKKTTAAGYPGRLPVSTRGF